MLKVALSVSEKVEIGLTTQNLLNKKQHASKLEEYNARADSIIEFVSSFTELNRINIVEIRNWNDMNRYTLTPDYEGLVVSQETYQNALKLSNEREEKGLKPLVLVVVPLIKDMGNQKLSSATIRKNL
ncbi:hypothetical protein LCGC14_1172520 [marine sediment metagenome]|uniref:Uncharacterized protein n=1 Tax=marine sediment metagenome TaxID=412755 RepID=A0A0F9LUC3_9ZZZZ